MGLKVLLADESSSIKKALQLALSDYAVEVKSVPSGLDVLSVALDFRPDIVLADVLLTKKSGYEVCKEIRSHALLQTIPVILMWSSFMEFDQALAEKNGYNDKLEKPFDTETLLQKINALVAKTKSHPLDGLLNLPPMPNFAESETFIRQRELFQKKTEQTQNTKAHSSTTGRTPTKPNISLVDSKEDVFENSPGELDEFQPVQLKGNDPGANSIEPQPNYNDVHIETENYGDFEEVVLVKTSDKDSIQGNIQAHLQTKMNSEIQSYLENSPVSLNKSQQFNNQRPMSKFDEQLMREEVRLMAEKICWHIIPDIAEKIVREEIQKLMKNIEKNI